MSRIPDEERNIMEKSIFLPMALTVFHQDIRIIQESPFKIKAVYLQMVEQAIKAVHKDLQFIKRDMHKKKLKVYQLQKDDLFTQFMFIYNGYQEQHHYFNPAIRNYVHQFMEQYICLGSQNSK